MEQHPSEGRTSPADEPLLPTVSTAPRRGLGDASSSSPAFSRRLGNLVICVTFAAVASQLLARVLRGAQDADRGPEAPELFDIAVVPQADSVLQPVGRANTTGTLSWPYAGRVFGVGMFKTGTTSLASALDTLGYHGGRFRTVHPDTGLEQSTTTTGFTKVLTEQNAELSQSQQDVHYFIRTSRVWNEILHAAETATAFADGPWLYLFRELDDAFPGSKFVLTTRAGGGQAVAESDYKMWVRMGTHTDDHRSKEEILAALSDRYEQHVRAVRAHFLGRPGQLLELCMSCNTGPANWRALVDFLHGPGSALPQVAFPMDNTEETGFGN